MIRAMLAIFRGIMVVVLFILFLVLFIAASLAVYGAGLFLTGSSIADLTALAAAPAGVPPPAQLAGVLIILAALFTSMWAMIVSESAPTVGRFIRRVVKTATIWAVIFAIPLVLMAMGGEGGAFDRFRPAVLYLIAMIAGALAVSILLGKLFLVYVSEKPRRGRRPRRERPAPAPEPAPPEPEAPLSA
jgi:hypothetical protein